MPKERNCCDALLRSGTAAAAAQRAALPRAAAWDAALCVQILLEAATGMSSGMEAPPPTSKLSTKARVEKQIEKQIHDKGLTVPLPPRFEEVEGGFKLRVQAPDARTKDWRPNYKAARPGTEPTVETQRPDPPLAYFLPKAILQRMPDESLNSKPFSPE